MTSRDIQTRIKCVDCGEYIMHRYKCVCKSYWGYCSSNRGNCSKFFCVKCDQEKKVAWSDEEPMISEHAFGGKRYNYDDLTAAQQKGLNLVLDTPEVAESEKEALRAIFRRIATPGTYEE